ncbi:oxygen-independent coproporphyrinogen III oxidase [Amaricoccus sp.]|uniref:oxygen-independent coproporphyrinogen III oxidase n=1 Tax=Amaricoccus sp. TaxID=1872485 RepID=UPI001B546B1A|nr:oxygen-independent coproporphyrinogen III oxidase [Amaricoccus sp.]MBP7002654.1 oxygen-independent coproporphyrinogen III oxidase [Amaricoccus sp.]
MDQIDRLRRLGLFDSRVPRYTSFPTTPNFSPSVGARFQAECLAAVDPAEPVSVYVHIPFCERLCWFCACHTQGTKTLAPVEAYIAALEAELALVAASLPPGVRMGRLHWGGGTPTILPPPLIHRLAAAIRAAIPPADTLEFSVEIDPTQVDRARIAALAEEGMTRASLGVQDFDPLVQQAIGRLQSFEATREAIEALRDCGVESLNADLVYGLPHQTLARLDATLERTLSLRPDRLALFGYAHVPWVAKRQKLIDAAALPDDLARWRLAGQAAGRLVAEGFDRIGIDHFARPADALAQAAREGRLRRNFQGYTDDLCPTLIGVGASSVSRFPAGYVQNAPATAAWGKRVTEGGLAGVRGHALSDEDRLRARAIEMLLCDFRLDFTELAARFGTLAAVLGPTAREVLDRFDGFVTAEPNLLAILPEGAPLARIIASAFDDRLGDNARFSRAS